MMPRRNKSTHSTKITPWITVTHCPTKAIVLQIASLTDVDWPMSGEVVLMALVGGLGTVFGPVAGALIIIAMQTYLAQVGQWVTVIQGVIFVLCVLLFRRGIIGELAAYLRIRL